MFGDAEAYEKYMGRWSARLAPIFLDFADIRDSARVLDIGSGTGVLSFAIAEARPRCTVVGIDPSSEYVAFAQSRHRMDDRVSFERGDAQSLRFPDASFDHCLALLVFNFIPDSEKALREAARVTKPAGRIAAAVWDYGSGMRMLRVFWDAAVALDPDTAKIDENHMRLSRSGELMALWKKVGLANVREQPLDFTMRFSSLADFWDPFLQGQGPAGAYVRSLDPAKQQALREELKRQLNLKSDQTAFDLPARAWAVRGDATG